MQRWPPVELQVGIALVESRPCSVGTFRRTHMLDLEEHAAIITTRSVLRVLRGQLLLCVAAWLLCSIAHQVLQAPL